MSFKQNIHLDKDVEHRVDHFWDFKPSSGLVSRQQYCVMSIVCPDGTNQKSKEFGIKVFGCFESLEKANQYAKELQEECNAFDYYTVETQCWAKLPPQVEKLDDQNYQEEELESLKNTIIKSRKARVKMLEERMMMEKADNKKKLMATSKAPEASEAEAEAKSDESSVVEVQAMVE